MRTMSGSPCLHYDCSNRNSFGYCRTTVCINEHYQQEQWGLPSTINKSESVVKKPQTNADRIRAMTDEELANILDGSICPPGYNEIGACEADEQICKSCWLDWLREAADEKS